MPKKKIVLTIPKNLVGEPIVYKLVKSYNLVVSVLRAQVTNDEDGKIVLELDGAQADLDEGLKYLKSQGVTAELLRRDIRVDESRCIDCGACTAVCSSKALSLDKASWELNFDRAKCVLCGLCKNACPMRAIQVTF